MAENNCREELVSALQKEFQRNRLSFYSNVFQRRYLRVNAQLDGPFEIDVADKMLVAWLARFAVKQGLLTPTIAELKAVAIWITGESLGAPMEVDKDKGQLSKLLDEDLTIAVFYEWASREIDVGQALEIGAEDLWKKLNEKASALKSYALPSRNFAGGPNILMRKLNANKGALAALRIHFEAKRSNGCKLTVRRLDDSTQVTSATASAPTAEATCGYSGSDDRTMRLENLRQKGSSGNVK